MRNAFPSPYTLADAEAWVALATGGTPCYNFAVCRPDGTYAGGVGLKVFSDDVEYRTLEMGYWLGQAHWGTGLATAVVRAFTPWAFENSSSLSLPFHVVLYIDVLGLDVVAELAQSPIC